MNLSSLKNSLIATLTLGLIGLSPISASAAFTNSSILGDGRAYGNFAQFVAAKKVVGENTWDIDNFEYVAASGDGKVVVAAGYVSEPLVYGVYGWTNADTDWSSRTEYDFLLKGDVAGTKNFYYTKISHDGNTVIGRSDDGIYIWEKPVGGWSGEILPTVVQGNSVANPFYSLSFYGVGAFQEQNIEIAGDGSFIVLGGDFNRNNSIPVIVLNRVGSSWSGFDTATAGYVRIEAPVIENGNYWGANLSVNPLKNEIAIAYQKDQILIYDNLGNLLEDGFVVDPAVKTANPTIIFNNNFSLVGNTLAVSPFIPNTQVTKEILIYANSASGWDLGAPTTWSATGMFGADQNSVYFDLFVLEDEMSIVVTGYSGALIIQKVEGVWESISGRPSTTYFYPSLTYYEDDGDVVVGGISGKVPYLSHPATKPPALIDLVVSSTSEKFNQDIVPALKFDFSYDPTYKDSIWGNAFIKLDGNNNAISSAAPGGTIINTNAGLLVAGQTYNVCVYPYTTTAANGLTGDPVCFDVKPGGPSQPSINKLNPVDGGFDVQIYPYATAPTSAPVTAYEYSIDGGTSWLALTNSNGKYLISGLTNGTEYDVIIRAKNSVGAGPASESVSGTPNPPQPATNVVATAGNGSATVSFTAGTGAAYYKVKASPGTRTCNAYSPNFSCTVSGLTNGTEYTFTVESLDNSDNVLATSTASDPVTPTAGGGGGGSAPAAPNAPTTNAGDGEVTVSWTAVSGATSYTVTSNPDGKTCTTSGTSCVVQNLTNGTSYTFSVVATNSNGSSAPSSASGSVTPTVGGGSAPAAPGTPTVTAGDGKVTVSWAAVAGATSYTVTSDPDGLTCTTSGTSCVVRGLTNGTAYTFTVVATNGSGSSAASGSSSSVTPAPSNDGGNGSSSFENDPKLEYRAPLVPVTPGATTALNGGVSVPTTQKKFGSSSAVKIVVGGQNPSSATVRSVINGTKSPLPLREVDGVKSLAPEKRSELKIKLNGYKRGSQVQIYLANSETGDVTFLGYSRVRKDGSVVKKLRLPAGLDSGAYNLQVNGYGAKTDKVRVNKLSIGTYLIDKALDRAYFDADSSSLNSATKAGLDKVMDSLVNAATVYVYSYTTGDPGAAFKEANDKLAAKRAERVRRYLVANGVNDDAIVVITVGAVMPRDRNKEWQNRRVDIYINYER